ncbi:hypothetical protein M5D96_008514 [Drosophila gunungcola]|uniref:Uncharacterized protein n=1 Tax=Drosophila gunungcola TaxID=103775 RepID=A0A9P9YKH8_9MUSC|nr:hypothetical protein M5D96_008514 [Drosophila gunungcola]
MLIFFVYITDSPLGLISSVTKGAANNSSNSAPSAQPAALPLRPFTAPLPTPNPKPHRPTAPPPHRPLPSFLLILLLDGIEKIPLAAIMD